MLTINIPLWLIAFALGWVAGVVSVLLFIWWAARKQMMAKCKTTTES